jgi:hypothetical protein
MPQNATASPHLARPGVATSRQPRRQGLPPGTAAASERPCGRWVTAHGCRTNDPCGDETTLSCVSCGVRVCACSVHWRVLYHTSYTVLHCHHSLTLCYTILHNDSLSYTIIHYYTLLYYYTNVHCPFLIVGGELRLINLKGDIDFFGVRVLTDEKSGQKKIKVHFQSNPSFCSSLSWHSCC